MFWAAVAGIVTGAGFFTLAIVGSIIIGLILFLFIKHSSIETPYLLVINCDGDESEREVHNHITKSVKRYNVKQKTVSANNIELTLELRLDDKVGGFVNTVSDLKGVKNALLISYSGDYVS